MIKYQLIIDTDDDFTLANSMVKPTTYINVLIQGKDEKECLRKIRDFLKSLKFDSPYESGKCKAEYFKNDTVPYVLEALNEGGMSYGGNATVKITRLNHDIFDLIL